jgi:hypothetical protein
MKSESTTGLMERLGAIFHRRATTKWSPKEVAGLRAISPIDNEDLIIVERFYLAESEKANSGFYTRRSLLTLLNNWPGEVDKARRWERVRNRAERRISIL